LLALFQTLKLVELDCHYLLQCDQQGLGWQGRVSIAAETMDYRLLTDDAILAFPDLALGTLQIALDVHVGPSRHAITRLQAKFSRVSPGAGAFCLRQIRAAA
jgi:hypothetical protein